MIEILKKQWFVVLIAIVLIGFSIFAVADTNKGKLPGKTMDGIDIVASVADANISADDLFNKADKTIGDQALYSQFERAVANAAIETTSDMKADAKTQANQVLAQFKQQYPNDYQIKLDSTLKGLGYSDLDSYFLVQLKIKAMNEAYISEKLDELFTPIYETKNPRDVEHILIKMVDSKNPTAEELDKVKKVEDALASGKSFREVATEFSDDTGSKENGGNVGYTDTDSQWVAEFKTAALSLKKDEVSDWVKVTSSNYSGWHKIKVVETDKAALEKDENVKDGLYNAILTNNPDLAPKILMEKAETLKVEYANDDVKNKIQEYINNISKAKDEE